MTTPIVGRLVRRFRSPHHSCRDFVMRSSEPKPHWINELPLARWLDYVAIRPPRHQAILHFAGRRQFTGEPQPDREKNCGDDQTGDCAAAIVALLGVGHRSDLCWRCRLMYQFHSAASYARRMADGSLLDVSAAGTG